MTSAKGPRTNDYLRDWPLLLVMLTLLAGLLRFYAIDHPVMWGDEAATFGRVCGDYDAMLDALEDQGFPPLHYQLYWWIGQGMPIGDTLPAGHRLAFTPLMMRFVPALAGTLMVPAVYFLAVQLARQRVALLAAAFAACSAYLLVYSRDAKMYSHAWLFSTLNVGCLLWWLRTRNLNAFLSWVASGVLMAGTHLTTLLVLPAEVVALIVHRNAAWADVLRLPVLSTLPFALFRSDVSRNLDRLMRGFRWPLVLPFLAGLTVILFGPVVNKTYYQEYFNRTLRDNGTFSVGAGGISWVQDYNRGRNGFDLFAFTATTYLTAWEWPQPRVQAAMTDLNRRGLKSAVLVITAVLAVGIVPWSRWGRHSGTIEPSPGAPAEGRVRAAAGVISVARCADARPHPTSPGVPGEEPKRIHATHRWRRRTLPELRGWRSVLTLAAWLVLPSYAVYLLSGNAQTPWQILLYPFWHEDLLQPMRVVAVAVATVLGVAMCGRTFRDRVQHALTLALPCAAVVGAAWVLWWVMDAYFKDVNRASIWMPRYLGTIWPAFAIVVAALLLRLPTRTFRVLAIALLISVNLVQFGRRLTMGTEPPNPVLAHDLVQAATRDEVRVVTSVNGPNFGGPGTGLIWSLPLRQYIVLAAGLEVQPEQVRGEGRPRRDRDRMEMVERGYQPFGGNEGRAERLPARLERAARDATIQRLILWEGVNAGKYLPIDDLSRALPGWHAVTDDRYIARDHWTWAELTHLRRRILVRDQRPIAEP